MIKRKRKRLSGNDFCISSAPLDQSGYLVLGFGINHSSSQSAGGYEIYIAVL